MGHLVQLPCHPASLDSAAVLDRGRSNADVCAHPPLHTHSKLTISYQIGYKDGLRVASDLTEISWIQRSFSGRNPSEGRGRLQALRAPGQQLEGRPRQAADDGGCEGCFPQLERRSGFSLEGSAGGRRWTLTLASEGLHGLSPAALAAPISTGIPARQRDPRQQPLPRPQRPVLSARARALPYWASSCVL